LSINKHELGSAVSLLKPLSTTHRPAVPGGTSGRPGDSVAHSTSQNFGGGLRAEFLFGFSTYYVTLKQQNRYLLKNVMFCRVHVLCVVLRLVTNDTLFLRLGILFSYMFNICIFFSRKLQEICVRSYILGTLFCVSAFSMFEVS
jgi:hypothetical protein